MDTSYYVYALKDPRKSPAMPFYIGKGVGTRAHDHLVRPDETRKGLRIKEIIGVGQSVIVAKMAEGLTEAQAIKIEADLISAYGTEETGGPLTNAVLPSGLAQKTRAALVIPQGVRERAQIGLALLKDALHEFGRANPKGITNGEAASLRGLRSDYGGGSKDYFSYSILGILMREGKIARQRGTHRHVAATS
jgi:hypothetical protein